MVDIVVSVLLSWFFVEGIYAASRPGMLLDFLQSLEMLAPAWVCKPLVSCPVCMCSVWGSACHVALGLCNNKGLEWYLLTFIAVPAAAGLMSIVIHFASQGSKE